mgnify:CR=1 FL=1
MRTSGSVVLLFVSVILTHGAGCASSPGTRFYKAVSKGDVAALAEALAEMEPESRQDHLDGGLRNAADTGNKEMILDLLSRGAQVESSGDRGTTALMLAARQGHTEIVALLLERGADPKTQRSAYGFGSGPQKMDDGTYLFEIKEIKQGLNALAEAVKHGHVDAARLLLEHGTNPNKVLIVHGVGDSLPFFGSSLSTGDLTVVLSDEIQYRKKGNTVRATYHPRYEAKTVLHVAVDNDDEQMVKLLVTHGSDPNILDNNGVSAMDLAQEQKKEWLIPILQN